MTKSMDKVYSTGLGFHIFWILLTALGFAYTLSNLHHDFTDAGVLERLVDFIVAAAWMAWLSQEIAVVAQGRYRKPVPQVDVDLTKKATAEDVR